jgi:predicted metal-dependent HD superfamily phosphohydrolase
VSRILPLAEVAALSTLYSESHRHYHNMRHIQSMIAELNLVHIEHSTKPYAKGAKPAFHFDRITAMIWYHDAYYDPYTPGLNEHLSAELFRQAGGARSPDFVKEVLRGIQLSAQHTVQHDDASPSIQLFLDLDLLGFGRTYEEFNHNTKMIRLEYDRTSELDFMQGRIKFLTMLDARPRIFYTDRMHTLYEEIARRNIKTDIKCLSILQRTASTDIPLYAG